MRFVWNIWLIFLLFAAYSVAVSPRRRPLCSQWSVWGPCNVTCGGGEQKRTRSCLYGYLPKTETQPCNTQKCHSRIDLGILIDASSSIQELYLRWLKNRVLHRFVKKLNIGKNKTRVAVATFDVDAKALNNFKKNSSFKKKKLKRKIINKISLQTEYGTRMEKGINTVKTFFSKASGDRKEYPNVLVVFTDGKQFPRDNLHLKAIHDLTSNATLSLILFVGYGPPTNIDRSMVKKAAGAAGATVIFLDLTKRKKTRKIVNEIVKTLREVALPPPSPPKK